MSERTKIPNIDLQCIYDVFNDQSIEHVNSKNWTRHLNRDSVTGWLGEYSIECVVYSVNYRFTYYVIKVTRFGQEHIITSTSADRSVLPDDLDNIIIKIKEGFYAE